MPANLEKDAFSGQEGVTAPARRAGVITPHDVNETTLGGSYPKAFYVGGAGNVAILPVENGDTETVTLAVLAGSYHAIQVRKVLATGTTATGIVGLL